MVSIFPYCLPGIGSLEVAFICRHEENVPVQALLIFHRIVFLDKLFTFRTFAQLVALFKEITLNLADHNQRDGVDTSKL